MNDIDPLLSAWWRELQMIDDGTAMFDLLAPPKKPKPQRVIIMGMPQRPINKENTNDT